MPTYTDPSRFRRRPLTDAYYQPPGTQGGLLTDFGAARANAVTGNMPTKTAGGRFGMTGTYGPHDGGQYFEDVTSDIGNGYGNAGRRESMLGLMNGYRPNMAASQNALAEANPNGRWYQGATPGMVSTPGGMRPGFVGPPQEPAANQNAMRDWGRANGMKYIHPQTGTIMGDAAGGALMGATPQQIRAMQVAGRGPNQQPAAALSEEARYHKAGLASPEERRLNMAERASAAQDSRRFRRGEMTMEERAQFGIPGYANTGLMANSAENVARTRADADQNIASTRAGADIKVAENNANIQKLMHDAEIARVQGNIEMERAARQEAARLAKETAEIHGQYGVQQEEARGRGLMGVAGANNQYREDEMTLRREELAQRRADALRSQAEQAYQSGDIRRGQELEQRANQAMGGGAMSGPAQAGAGSQPVTTGQGTGQGGLMGPPTAGRVPPQARAAIDSVIQSHKGNPQVMVSRLRELGLTDEQINIELANAFGPSGLFFRKYPRTAQDPGGWGFGNVDPNTGKARHGLFFHF